MWKPENLTSHSKTMGIIIEFLPLIFYIVPICTVMLAKIWIGVYKNVGNILYV